MWIIGTLVFYLFYRFTVVWYLRLWTFSDPLQRPYLWRSGWYHICIFAISITLLTVSGYFFFRSNPWLSIAPIPLVLLSLIVFSTKRRNRLNSIISKAVEIQVRMEQQGEPQLKINQAISLATTGDDYTNEHDLKSFIKFSILSHEGLLSVSQGQRDIGKYVSQMRHIDVLIDHSYQARKHSTASSSAWLG